MSSLPVVAVLGSAPVAQLATDGLLCAGLTVYNWVLPSRHPAHKARARARSVSDWHRRLASCNTILTLFDDPYVLESVIVPHVLPAVRRRTLWLQLGPPPRAHVTQLTDLAQRLDVTVAHAPLYWSGSEVTSYGPPPSLTGRRDNGLQADVNLVYGSVIAALANADFIDFRTPADLLSGPAGDRALRPVP
ncbi:hypothetical protein [Streptomyces sp. NPDC048551]|uniref:hypothetical protein n=1 Tax=Streptomyces sp. NPDC048551 TaxID=3155758 RepID=UPI00342D339C